VKILVTGATGFIGSNLTRKLIELGHEVLTTGREDEQPHVPGTTCLGYKLDEIQDSQLKGVEMIYHQAANNDTQVMNNDIFLHENVIEPCHLFNQLRNLGCRKYVYASSTAVYGNSPAPYVEDSTPLDERTPYARSKSHFEWWIDKFVHWFDISAIGLRYCNVYGPGETHKSHRASMIHQIIKKMKNGENPKLFANGEQRRDWVHVDDVVNANIRCMIHHPKQDIINIGSGASHSFNEIVSTVNQELGTIIQPEWIENPYGELYQIHTECQIEKARTLLMYEPSYNLHSGIHHYLANWN
jgi:ADP-L-glycero-D-manno-heptose 6-epimerase